MAKFIKYFSIIFIFIFFIVTINAAALPWDNYAKYIPNSTPIAKRHFRGVWITTIYNLDWPSTTAKESKTENERIKNCKAELIKILDQSVEMNFNAVILQVSPHGDAFYNSKIVPWSKYLTGTFSKNPGFDPLKFAIEEAHKRNLELHAWFNPYRISMDVSEKTQAELNIDKSVFKEHREWIKACSGQYVVDPGIPEARNWVEDRVMEVVNNYDIDGIHFDDYFYTESKTGDLDDKNTFEKYNLSSFKNLGDFRRNNTYLLIKELDQKIHAAKSWVKFGVSPAAVCFNKSVEHPEGSNTSGYECFSRSYADTKKWVEEEIVDYIAPQVYFTFDNKYVPYGEITNWWADICKEKNVHLYIGQALYKVNSNTDTYFSGQNAILEFSNQLKFNTTRPNVKGSIFFRYRNLNDSNKVDLVNKIKNDIWNTKSFIPVMPWKNEPLAITPINGTMSLNNNNPKLTWQSSDKNTSYFAIYKFKNNETFDPNLDSSANNLIATIRKTEAINYEFIDTKTLESDTSFYVITALNRLHNESEGLFIKKSVSRYFPDVSTNYNWAVEAIDDLYTKKILSGYPNGNFIPNKEIIRGDFISLLANAFNISTEFNNNFLDVPREAYYYSAIGSLKKLSLVTGFNNLFYPDRVIKREEAFTIIFRILKSINSDIITGSDSALLNYQDISQISSYARTPIATLTQLGLVKGYLNNIYPKLSFSRAESAVLIYNVLKNLKI